MMGTENTRQTILIVDDVPENIDVLRGALEDTYRIKAAIDGQRALEIVNAAPPDLILLDVMMPGMDGHEVCRRLKADAGTRNIPVLFVTARSDIEAETLGFQLGAADYLAKPVSPPIVRERVKTHLALYDQNRCLESMVEERTSQLRKAYETVRKSSIETIQRLSRAAEYKDEDTGAHILRMSGYSAAVATRLGLEARVVDSIRAAAPMHDIGKIGIPDRILLKPGRLNAEEWKIMKQHTVFGANILDGARGFVKLGAIIAMTHHEKWDGSGYPLGLRGREIPLVGRITAISDVFDALTSRRPYKEPFSLEKSYRIIREGSGSHFDPEVVAAFFACEPEILEIRERYQDEGLSPMLLTELPHTMHS